MPPHVKRCEQFIKEFTDHENMEQAPVRYYEAAEPPVRAAVGGSDFLRAVSNIEQHRTIPALRLKHRFGGYGTASALPKCSIIHKVLSALLA